MSEKNSATLKMPYTTQYVSHVVSSSLLELSMALMLQQERRGHSCCSPPAQTLRTPEQACCCPWCCQEGLESFLTTTLTRGILG